ncbi:MAG: hypothetical protein KDF65_08030, partial [Anaerolineae bacterium]|nr:hypothetical protein [Anaerolineae bacterium]
MHRMRPVQRVFLIVIILFFFNQRASASTQAQNDRLPLVQSGAQGVSLTWTLPEYTISPQTIAGVSYSRLTMAGLTAGGEPGWPELPRYSRLIGLPPAGSARVEIVELRQETVSLPLPPLPAAGPQPLTPAEMESHRLPTAGPVVRQPEPTVYQTDQLYPAEAVALGPPHQVRDQRLAVLTITPLQVNPVNRTLRVVTYLRLEIIFSEVPPLAAKQSEPLAGLDRALQAVLLNPEALGWSAPPAPVAARPPAAEAVGNSLKIVTNSGGLYALTYTDLQNASFPVASLNPQTLKLTRGYPR